MNRFGLSRNAGTSGPDSHGKGKNAVKRIAVKAVALCALCLLATTGVALSQEVETMPASEVKPGMTGYGLTTLKGIERQKFDFEVVGVMPGYFADSPMIIINMSGDTIDLAGIIAGMSGSPVFINDKLVGAVAYGWPYSKIPLAGVTPIGDMLQIKEYEKSQAEQTNADRKAHRRTVLRRRSKELAQRLTSPEGQEMTSADLRRRLAEMLLTPPEKNNLMEMSSTELPDRVQARWPGLSASRLQPLPVPMSMSGMSASGINRISSLFEDSGFMPVQSTSSGAMAGPDPEIRPGAPVGAAMVTGDLTLAGTGTLTWMKGNRILAFGHSMDGNGPTNYPLAVGKGAVVVPSVRRSFRMCSLGEIVGRIVQDREAAILGRLDKKSPMFPCTVNVKGAFEKTYNYNIAGFWQMAPMLTYTAITESILRLEGSGLPATISAESRIKLKDRSEPIVLRNTYASTSPTSPALELTTLPLDLLTLNPFKRGELEKVEFNMEIEQGYNVANIEAIRLNRNQFVPGETVTIYVKLRKYHGEEFVKQVEYEIPEDARPGSRVKLQVCDGPRTLSLRMAQDPGFFEPQSFDQLIEGLKLLPDQKALYVHGTFLRNGIRYEGEAMPDLPQSALRMFQISHESGDITPLQEDVQKQVGMPMVVEGSQSTVIQIIQPEKGVSNPY